MRAAFRTARIPSCRRNNWRIIDTYITTVHGKFVPAPPNANVVAFSVPDYNFRRRLPKYYRRHVRLPVSEIAIATPPSSTTVPNVIGLDAALAVAQITNASLLASTAPSAQLGPVLFNRVLTQSVPGGTAVPFGTTISLTVQSLTFVPNVVGQLLATGLANITAAHLVNGTPVNQISTQTPGTIIAQDNTAGSQVPGGTVVTLTVAIGGTGFRVQAVTAGEYNGTYYTPGQVFDLLKASDYSDSTQNYESGGGEYSVGWMIQVPQSTPLTLSDGNASFPPVDPNRRFVE